MSQDFTVGLVQVNSGPRFEDNLDPVTELIRHAAERGADLVITPEMTDFYEPRLDAVLGKALPQDEHPLVAAASELAADLDLLLLLGSVNIRVDETVRNRSILIDASGDIVATYDKIHMFDVEIPDGQTYRESSIYTSGNQPVIAPTPWGALGITICYDVRFPILYRQLAQASAQFLAVPAAFTALTGSAHWHTLLRARAIETGCFVFAAAQCGEHAGGRQTFGHSLVIDPWGEILAEADREPGVVTAHIDPTRVSEVRRMIPSLAGD